MLADRRYCYPLTITDGFSRYLLCCDALEAAKEIYAFSVFERAFMHYDLGFFDDQSCRVGCAPNPFGAKALPMSPE